MDSSPDLLAENIRAKRQAIDEDLRLLRGKLRNADPRNRVDARQLAGRVLPLVAGTAALWAWNRHRRRIHSLDQLLIHGLTGLYRTERRLVPVLERMGAQSSNDELARAFAQHRLETEGHLDRLHRVFRSVGARPRRGSSSPVAAIVADGERLLSRHAADRDVRDAWLIATAQRLEHFEIASYATVQRYAEMLGFTLAAQLLQQTLEEELAADEKLTHLAERFVNPQSIRASRAM
jgi:ferritin-like metal-binding protein YciE